jgi:hypothetical protein
MKNLVCGSYASFEPGLKAMQEMEKKMPKTTERRPLTWDTLPLRAKKCARHPSVPDDAPVQQVRCSGCNEVMWSRNPKLEDICEECEARSIQGKHDQRIQRERARGGMIVNPFAAASGNSGKMINPFGGGARLL